MSRYMLQKTGIGFLVSKPSDRPEIFQSTVRALKERWQAMAMSDDALHGSYGAVVLPVDRLPFRGTSAKKFMHTVGQLASWMKSVDGEIISDETFKGGAMAVAITSEDAAEYHSSPTVRSMLARMFDIATAKGRAARLSMSAVRNAQAQVQSKGVSAKVVVNDIERTASADALAEVDQGFAELGVDSFSEKRRPRQFAKATNSGSKC